MLINEYDSKKSHEVLCNGQDEAVRDWHDDAWMLATFGEIPRNVVDKLLVYNDGDDIDEVTTPVVGDAVYVYNIIDYPQIGEVVEVTNDGQYKVKIDDDIVTSGLYDLNIIRSGYLPSAAKFFFFRNNELNKWVERGGNVILSNMGFRVYTSEDFGFVFGTDDLKADEFLSSRASNLKVFVNDGKIVKENLYV